MMHARISVSFAVALLVAGAALAQERLAPDMRAKIQTEFMTKKLGLKADQIPKVQEINLKYAQKMEPVLKGNEGPLVKLRAAKAIDQDKDAELERVLSKEQYQQYLASKEEMREKVEQRIEEKRQGAGN
jgi:uncharacterized protein YaiL (DUF2058 family)